MIIVKHFILIAVAALTLPSCASITRGSTDVLEVVSTPQGAQVSTENGYSCLSTPCALKMSRKTETVVTVSKPGCRPARVNVTHKVANAGAAGMAGNVLVGGIIGAAVDASSGAMNDLVPNPVNVSLDCG